MVAALTLALALGPMGPDPGPAQLEVGPIHLGERVKDVERTLGPGWRGPVFDDQAKRWRSALVLTDGVDQLLLWLVPTTDEGEIVEEIVGRENRAQGGAISHPTVLRNWRWDLGPLFEMPVASHGWTGGRLPSPRSGDYAIAQYSYGHPLAVWYTKNQWGGVDFHMFEE